MKVVARDLEGGSSLSKELESFGYWYLWTCENYSQTECERLSTEQFKVKASIRNADRSSLARRFQSATAPQFRAGRDDVRKDARDITSSCLF